MTHAIRLIERGATPAQSREIPINEHEFLIGRGADCNLKLRSDEISRHHCTIRVSSDGATLMDLGSSNGTYLNGQRVRSQADLTSGDERMTVHARVVNSAENRGGQEIGLQFLITDDAQATRLAGMADRLIEAAQG